MEKRLERAAFYDVAAEGTRAATCNEALASSSFGWTELVGHQRRYLLDFPLNPRHHCPALSYNLRPSVSDN